ncbi:MAG TPA: hypothetical protein VEJ88_00485 [Dissulfurispiraceae bacterium]|nr:hypothetical protein [Dissulfurispiraceae bacterium]
MKKNLRTVVALFAVVLLIALQVMHAASYAGSELSGKVAETMNSGGYTYVLLEKDGEKTWVAVPQIKVTKGQTISFKPGYEMENFTSKTLKRTFEKIIFSAGPVE